MSPIVMRQVDGITVLDVSKSFMEMSRTSEDGGQLHKLVTESLDSGHKQIVLNMSQVRYCGHKALSEMTSALKTIRARGGDLKLSNVPPTVRAVLEMTRLIKIYDTYDDEAAAIQSFLPSPRGSFPQTRLVTREKGGVTIVEVPKHIMLASSHGPDYPELREVVAHLLANGHKKIVFDLSQSEAICPGGIGELIRTFTSIGKCGGQSKLANVQPRVLAVLKLTHLETVFDIQKDEASAIQSFGTS